MTAASRYHWWLSAEPLGGDVAWALTRAALRRPPSGPVGAGLATGLDDVRRLATAALPDSDGGPDGLWSGPLADASRERDLAVRLGAALLPRILRQALGHVDPAQPDTLTIAVRGWLARVPWDSLAVDAHGEVRLVERARVLGGLPATLDVGRARRPDPNAAGPAVRVIDPGPRGDGAILRLYPAGLPPQWLDRCMAGEDIASLASGRSFSREHLAQRLGRGRPQRLFYFGHALPGTAQAPAAAALLLSSAPRTADVFTAFAWLAEPDRYPAPPRVAVVGCGSDDSAGSEQSGLPIAAVNAGAELVTATRWILPMDRAGGPTGALGSTTALAMAVDDAHRSPAPLDGLRRWQLDRLHAWRRGGAADDAPLLWASLVSYRAPDRTSEGAAA